MSNRLRNQLRQQQAQLMTHGSLSFYDCSVQEEDVRALVDQVSNYAQKGYTPLRRVAFDFCRFQVDGETMRLLQEFFASTNTIETLSFVKNDIDNDNLALLLREAHNKELKVLFKGGRPLLNNRHLILQACRNRLEYLNLDYKGSVLYSRMDQDLVDALGGMQRLQQLKLDGFAMDDSLFTSLVQGLRGLSGLKELHLARIRGHGRIRRDGKLTPASLAELSKLGANQDDGTTTCDLKELYIDVVPLLFYMGDRNGSLQEEDIEDIFRRLLIPAVTVKESLLSPGVVSSIFRALARNKARRGCSGVSVFCLKSWKFENQEFQVLLECLPQMALSKLEVGQGGIELTAERQGQILSALRPNTYLTSVEISYRGNAWNASSCIPLRDIMERNQDIRMVQKVLEQPAGRSDVERAALDQLSTSSSAANAIYLLLSQRIFATGSCNNLT